MLLQVIFQWHEDRRLELKGNFLKKKTQTLL